MYVICLLLLPSLLFTLSFAVRHSFNTTLQQIVGYIQYTLSVLLSFSPHFFPFFFFYNSIPQSTKLKSTLYVHVYFLFTLPPLLRAVLPFGCLIAYIRNIFPTFTRSSQPWHCCCCSSRSIMVKNSERKTQKNAERNKIEQDKWRRERGTG